MTNHRDTPPAGAKHFCPVDHETGERLELVIATSADVPRGRPWRRTVQDVRTGQRYRAWSKPYGIPGCICDAYARAIRGDVLPSVHRTRMEQLPDSRGTLEAAQGYARLRLPVIPLVGKVPAVRQWQRFESTPTNLRYWFGNRRSNVGLRTGESGYLVIDTDSPEAEEWVSTHCEETPMQAVSGSGSRHRYYRCPDHAEIRNRQGLFGIHGLDVRGFGGYIVLPPSVHPATGNLYEWLTDFSLPSGLPAFSPSWVHERKAAVRTAIAEAVNQDGILHRGRKYVEKIEPAVSGAGGHTSTFVAALKIVRFAGRNRAIAWELLRHYNATRCLPAWGEMELLHKLDEALKFAK
jgi:hypothetical protein